MIEQQLTQNQRNLSGQLVIRARAGYLPELITLATELAARANITTMGEIIQLPSAQPPPPPPDEEN